LPANRHRRRHQALNRPAALRGIGGKDLVDLVEEHPQGLPGSLEGFLLVLQQADDIECSLAAADGDGCPAGSNADLTWCVANHCPPKGLHDRQYAAVG
jgi:hypothetical protein